MIDLERCVVESEPACELPDLYSGWLDRYTDLSTLVKKAAEDGEKPAPETFLAEELVIAAALGYAVSRFATSFKEDVTDVLQREDYQRLDDAIAVASGKMRASFDEQTEDTVRKALHHEMKKGAVRAGFTLDSVVARFDQTQILDGMVRSAKFYTDSYFDKFVVPKLHKAVTEKFIQGNPDADSLHFIQKMLSEKLEGNHYWHVVGNASASRSYHYGVLKSGVMTRQLGYQVYAIIDDRTSSICKEMDGKEFWVADAVHVIERSAKAESAEEVKELQPWLKYSEIRELSTDELVSKGVMVPPFHGLCRSTIELVDVL